MFDFRLQNCKRRLTINHALGMAWRVGGLVAERALLGAVGDNYLVTVHRILHEKTKAAAPPAFAPVPTYLQT